MCDRGCDRLHIDQTGGQGADIARWAWIGLEALERRNGVRPPLTQNVTSLLELLAASATQPLGRPVSRSVSRPTASLPGISPARVRWLAGKGRLPGAVKLGGVGSSPAVRLRLTGTGAPVQQLDRDAAIGLAGGDVADLGEAQAVEEVRPEHVADAEQAAADAEAKAAQSEPAAVLGALPAVQAAADRETARFARLRAAVTARRARRAPGRTAPGTGPVRHRRAEHAEGLAELKKQTEADLARIAELDAGIRERIGAWNDGLSGIVDRIGELDPEARLPGGVPRPSSAGVWGARMDRLPLVSAGSHVISGVNLEDRRSEGFPALIQAADRK